MGILVAQAGALGRAGGEGKSVAGEVTYRPMATDYAAANRANLVWAWRRRRTWRALVGITALMAGVGALFGWLDGRPDEIISLSAIYAVLGASLMPLIYLVAYLLAPHRVKRLVRQQPSATLEQRWAWDGEGFTIGHAQGSVRHRWAELFGWNEGASGFAFFMNERSFLPLPRSALTDGQADDLRAVVRTSGTRVH